MAEPYKTRVQQLLQDGLKSTKNYLSEHIDARSLVEQAQRNVRELARKAEQRLQEATGRKEQNGKDMGNFIDSGRPSLVKLPPNHESNITQNRNNVVSPRRSASNPSVLTPFVFQQPIVAPPGSPITILSVSNRLKSNLNNIPIRTSSSSGVSNSSSSVASPVISKSIHDNSHFQYVAIFDYDARTKDDLTIRKSDLLEIKNKKNHAWWKAKNEHGQEGWIPSNYVAKRNSLESEPWYFKSIRRIDAEKQLMSDTNEHGNFLIRDSETRRTDFSLSIRDYDSIKHYRIRQTEDGRFYIARRILFHSLPELVNHYSKTSDGLCVNLRKPCVHTIKPEPDGLSHNLVDNWEIDRREFILIRSLGSGQFGDVWEGLWNNRMPVAIKTLKSGSMNPVDFLAEATIMKKLKHPNLIQLYAVCTIQEPIYIVTELMQNGSLLEYLQGPRGGQLKMSILIYIATQIARGMAYLEQQNYIHRDLAARNVLVGENNIVKIADFGLARIIKEYAGGMYEAKEGTKFPIKWTAPEAALYSRFTIKSDVWSYGILLTELVTYGRIPYPGMTNAEVLRRVDQGYRLPQPLNCPLSLYTIMLECWNADPDLRPSFLILQYRLENEYIGENPEFSN
ncbi:unnamed protein product [Rotaria sordida]|uniref:Tyrosine-protein kinase n=1 Tax=Rotaria sordida TaxID=392033 RepID=A0A813X145_9BILA|nr:unnamed protein product [Rotaria sordida]CAF0865000.1 unnamed protein product [Rotaria sordida]CAF0910869.1 unnamed protein product [Rotaria sordida]CAF0937485.1 unnamed protein product [Rotaria sordida]CAF0938719.1 unnamed protein product [Rotaria sordida]